MTPGELPTFDEWIEYCFNAPDNSTDRFSCDASILQDDREYRLATMSPRLVADYMIRLCESPQFIASRYSDDQIAKATWFIFGCGSEFLASILKNSVPAELQAKCIGSISTLYTELYDRVCGGRGTEPDVDLRDCASIDSAVYMIWDMAYLDQPLLHARQYPHLVAPSVEVLTASLLSCRTSACRVSGLHGIGHAYSHLCNAGNMDIAGRLQQLIDRFLREKSPPKWLQEYAKHARAGQVQ